MKIINRLLYIVTYVSVVIGVVILPLWFIVWILTGWWFYDEINEVLNYCLDFIDKITLKKTMKEHQLYTEQENKYLYEITNSTGIKG